MGHPSPDPRSRSPDAQTRIARVGGVLVAAGRSTRMGFDKLWAPLGDRPVLAWSLTALIGSGEIDHLVLVVADDRVADAKDLLRRYGLSGSITVGGERRRDSVAAGLESLQFSLAELFGSSVADALDLSDDDLVVIHDGARPFLTPDLVSRGLAAARETGAAVAAVPVRDTIKRVADSKVVETLPRLELWAAQTPQVFRRRLLQTALASTAEDVTDEATLVEGMGGTVRVFAGEEANFKITTPGDLDTARALLQRRSPVRAS